MNVLNIDYHLDGYNVLANNCIDYNIAGAASFYNKTFLKLYCAIWGLHKNFINEKTSYDLSQDVLSELGLSLVFETNITKDNLLNRVKELIDLEKPILLSTNNAALFYSVVYKEKSLPIINHSVLINGYDAEKELIYIKESSINSGMIRLLTQNLPFSTYKITYEMFLEMYNNTAKILNSDEYKNCCLYYIDKVNDVVVEDLKKYIINLFYEKLYNRNDYLIKDLKDLSKLNEYSNLLYSEQYRRNRYYSLVPLFDILEELLLVEKDEDYICLKKQFFKTREKILNILAKYSYINKKMSQNKIIDLISETEKNNFLLCDLLKKYMKKNNVIKENINLTNKEGTIISADSFDTNEFKPINISYDSKINNDLTFWRSKNTIDTHWIMIDFVTCEYINKIVVEHLSNNIYITKDFEIHGENENGIWEMIKHINNNNKVINEIEVNVNKTYKKIKIVVNIPNAGADFSARIRKIEIFN